MTLDEAVKILRDELESPHVNYDPLKVKALQLGIQALKRERANRDNSDLVVVGLLLGETSEKERG